MGSGSERKLPCCEQMIGRTTLIQRRVDDCLVGKKKNKNVIPNQHGLVDGISARTCRWNFPRFVPGGKRFVAFFSLHDPLSSTILLLSRYYVSESANANHL